MKITSLYQLDNGDFPIAFYYDLTPETMAMLTDYPQTQLEGFFGGRTSSVGIVEIHYEQDMSWSDIAECMDGSHEAIIPIQYRNDWLVDTKVDTTDPAIVKIIDAMDRLKSNLSLSDWDFECEDTPYFRVLNRYAGLHGYKVISTSIRGTGQGEELHLLHIIPAARLEEHTTLAYEVAPYWEGNTYCIDVRLSSPYTDEPDFNESLGFIVGQDNYVLERAIEMVSEAIADVTTRKGK